MKTTFRFIIAAMAAIAVFSSCQKELVNESANKTTDGVRTISVQFDNSTKATLSGVTPTFTNNDKIRVSNSEKSEECSVTVGATTTFTTTLSGALTAIYPADAAVFTPGTPDGKITGFKVPSSQTGKVEDAIIAKAEIAAESSIATFNGVTALFEITPPSTAKKITVTSLKKVESGSRTGTATDINTEDTGKTVITVGDGSADLPSTIYVALVPGVNLTDLSFDAGENIGLKGIPMKDIKTQASSLSKNVEDVNKTASNTKYKVGDGGWHPYVIIGTKKWARMNIGASSEIDAGTYFAWGAVEKVYSALSSNTFTFPTDNPDSERYTGTWNASSGFADCNTPYYDGSDYSSSKYKDISSATLQLSDDAANANWGGSWRMPTTAEFNALASETKVWDSTNKGYTFGTSPNTIFLPAAGYGYGTGLSGVGVSGCYWSSSLNTGNPSFAYYLSFDGGNANSSNICRYFGQSVRALSE